MSDAFPILTNCISASMIHTCTTNLESKRTGKIYFLFKEVSACCYAKFTFYN